MKGEKTIREIMVEMHIECEDLLDEVCDGNCLACAPQEVAERWLPADNWTTESQFTRLMKVLDDWEQYELVRKQEAL